MHSNKSRSKDTTFSDHVPSIRISPNVKLIVGRRQSGRRARAIQQTYVCTSNAIIPTSACAFANVGDRNLKAKSPNLLQQKRGTCSQSITIYWNERYTDERAHHLSKINYVTSTQLHVMNPVDPESRHNKSSTAWPWATPACDFVAAVHKAQCRAAEQQMLCSCEK